jgi:hypothetical protein
LDVASQTRLRDQSAINPDPGIGTHTYLDMGAYELP